MSLGKLLKNPLPGVGDPADKSSHTPGSMPHMHPVVGDAASNQAVSNRQGLRTIWMFQSRGVKRAEP